MTGAVVLPDEAGIRQIVEAVVRRELAPVLDIVSQLVPPSPDRLMTRAEVATFLGVHERDIRRLVLKGLIPDGICLGDRRLRWRRDALEAALAQLEAEQANEHAASLTRSRSRASVSGVTAPHHPDPAASEDTP